MRGFQDEQRKIEPIDINQASCQFSIDDAFLSFIRLIFKEITVQGFMQRVHHLSPLDRIVYQSAFVIKRLFPRGRA